MYKTVHAYIFVDFHLRQLRRMQSTGYTVVRRVLPTHRIIFRYLFADQRFRWKSRLAKEPRDLRHKTSSSWLKGVFSHRQHCRICLASFSISSAKQAWIFFSMTNNNFVVSMLPWSVESVAMLSWSVESVSMLPWSVESVPHWASEDVRKQADCCSGIKRNHHWKRPYSVAKRK